MQPRALLRDDVVRAMVCLRLAVTHARQQLDRGIHTPRLIADVESGLAELIELVGLGSALGWRLVGVRGAFDAHPHAAGLVPDSPRSARTRVTILQRGLKELASALDRELAALSVDAP
jgi:hypothetical protein